MNREYELEKEIKDLNKGKLNWINYKLPTDFDRKSLAYWEINARLDELRRRNAEIKKAISEWKDTSIPIPNSNLKLAVLNGGYIHKWSLLTALGLEDDK